MADENKRANTRAAAVKSRQQNVTRKIVINEHVIMEKRNGRRSVAGTENVKSRKQRAHGAAFGSAAPLESILMNTHIA